ncbi:MAG TPA: HD domain-containing protein [Defluviitaleaceae bacterium]|nr:HD domain-containing protein [Defluviitaleaceae bacterium]
MSDRVAQTISTEGLKPGMVLAEDVFNSVGLRLFSEGTRLDDKSIAKIRMYEIDFVLIYEDVNIDYVKAKVEVESKSIRKVHEFKAFKSSYIKNVNTLQDYLTTIGEGKNVSITDLFSLSQEIVSEVQTKSDILAFMHNLKVSDDHTYTHSVNVSLLCNIFGQWLGFDSEKLKNITVAGLIHDIGKIKVDPNILNKPGKLTPEEFEEVKNIRFMAIG